MPSGVHELDEKLRAAGIDLDALVPDATGTICTTASLRTPGAVDALPVLVGPGFDAGLIRLRERIGAGGMGLIHVADQVALEREVAVKRAVPGATDRHEASSALLAEARITGALEHPHIVPVHALGKTSDGDVLLVMKRIEGVAWSKLLAERADVSDELDRHLDILADVCRAVHFAHTRGVVHRDLKPQNVMIGAFGEVYVLDWGIAASFGPAHVPGAPHISTLTGIAGTPQFMAPEMTTPGEGLDGRTDVYLLGGILHVILTGRPPHAGRDAKELMRAAFDGTTPTFPPTTDPELASLCKRALARDPRDRFASADELRAALADTRRHASARALAHAASAKLAALRAATSANAPSDVDVNRAYSACRFGFEQALQSWPACPDAEAGQRAALVEMARYEVRRGRADAARAFVDELGASETPPDVVSALASLDLRLAREAEERLRLERIIAATDVVAGAKLRAVSYVGASIAFIAMVAYAVWRGRDFGPEENIVICAIVGSVFAIAWARGRKQKAGGRISVTYMSAATAALAAMTINWVAFARAHVPPWAGYISDQMLFSAVIFGVGQAFERGILVVIAPLLLGAVAIFAFPEHALVLNCVSLVAGAAVLLLRWRTGERRVR